MQSIINTPKLGPVTISVRAIKYFSKICDGNMNKASFIAEMILKSTDIELLEVPAVIANIMASKSDNPDALEFWLHRNSSTMFLVKPQENSKLVEMAMKQDMAGFKFDSA